MRSYASAARSNGYTSFIERTPDWTLNASVSSESIDVPEYQPSTDRRPPMSRSGEVSSDSVAAQAVQGAHEDREQPVDPAVGLGLAEAEEAAHNSCSG